MADTRPCQFCGDSTKPREYDGAQVYLCGPCLKDLERLTGI